ncbi:MAG TPA: hypothetical protein VKS79_05785 [Gemmataceae bacterium]|nr:hypothetical protein [Gemmataceae bacterium]
MKRVPICMIAIILCAGCNSGSPKAKIHGKVTLDGQPVPTGSIAFIPNDGQGQTAGAIIKDGTYEAEVPVGSMRVEIRYGKVVGKRKLYDTADSPTVDTTEEQIPPRYNTQSEITETISKDKPEINFDLKSK